MRVDGLMGDGRAGRVAVVGAGAMGMSLAAVLGQVLEVVLVVRDASRAAYVESRGVVVHGLGHQVARARVVRSIGALGDCGAIDAVFVATKTTAIDQVGRELGPLLAGMGTEAGGAWVVSFQNGIASGQMLSERLRTRRVARMVLNYGARLREDGDVEVVQSSPPHLIGGPNPGCYAFSDALASCMSAGGMETRAVEDIEPYVWLKGITNAAMNPVAALVNMRIGEVLDSPSEAIVRRLVDEGLRVARGKGIELESGAEARIWKIMDRARDHLPSMVEDIRAGRSSEVGQLNRQVIGHAGSIGVGVPTHELITALIETFDWRVFRERGRSPSRTL